MTDDDMQQANLSLTAISNERALDKISASDAC